MRFKTLSRSTPEDFYLPEYNKKLKIDYSRDISYKSSASIYSRISEYIMPKSNYKDPLESDVDALIEKFPKFKIDSNKNEISSFKSKFDGLRQEIQKVYEKSIIKKEVDDLEKRFKATELPTLTGSVPPLTEEENEIVDKVFEQGQSGLVSQFKKVTVDYKDIYKLYPETWLNDEVINFYFELLSDRAANNQSLPSVHCFNTFFCSTLRDQGFAKVKRWTKRVDIFAKDLVFVPINQSYHWVLGVIDMKNKSVAVYDSLGGRHDHTLGLLLKYLQEEHMDKKKSTLDISDWKMETPKSIPQQKNMSDCGAFACTFAERLSRSQPFNFSQQDMITIRRRMAVNIYNKSI